jgi:hypothetical protein
MIPNGAQMAAALAVAAWVSGFGLVAQAGAAATAMICTNPASGATWQVMVDYDNNTVDSYPAHVSDTKVTWRDASDGGNYTLDRTSGKLTVVVASSTGGYFLYDRCTPKN